MKKRINELIERFKIRLIQFFSECDGMCDFYDTCDYCEKNQNK
jgi:hypothetical protein